MTSDKISNGIIDYSGKIQKAEKGKLPERVGRKAMSPPNEVVSYQRRREP